MAARGKKSSGQLPPVVRRRCEDERLQDEILPLLRGSVFHVTSRKAYRGIVAAGAILNNEDNRFPFTFRQSEDSFGRKRGCVCLFDLRTISDEELFGCENQGLDGVLSKFPFLNPPACGNNPVFLVLDSALYGELISWTAGNPHEVRIPHVEAWYPGSIPLAGVQKIIDVRVMAGRWPNPSNVPDLLDILKEVWALGPPKPPEKKARLRSVIRGHIPTSPKRRPKGRNL